MNYLWLVPALCVAACSSDDSGPIEVTTGTYHHYVTSTLRLPLTNMLQREYGLDLDGDPSQKPDNQLGNVFVALTSNSNADLQGVLDGAIAGGQVVLLHSVRADQLGSDKSVSWQVYAGSHGTPLALDGTDQLAIADGAVASEPVLGKTSNSKFAAAAAGSLSVELAISPNQPAITLDLFAAQVEAKITKHSCTGKLGGAITQHQLDTVLLPSVVGMMNAAIARDPACPENCEPGTSGALIVGVFDTDKDGMITLPELQNSAIIQTLLAPDLDLLDAAGTAFEPDGERESISLGLGFDCVEASFDAPAEVP